MCMYVVSSGLAHMCVYVYARRRERTRLEMAEKGRKRRKSGMAQRRIRGGVRRTKVMTPRSSPGASCRIAVVQ